MADRSNLLSKETLESHYEDIITGAYEQFHNTVLGDKPYRPELFTPKKEQPKENQAEE